MKGIITFLKSDFLRASAVFSGGSLDVGIFGVPFVFAQSGFLLTFVLFIILAIMVAIIHIMLAEIGERTPGKHRLIGYARIYLGDRGKALLTVTVLCGTVGALVVYVSCRNVLTSAVPIFWCPGSPHGTDGVVLDGNEPRCISGVAHHFTDRDRSCYWILFSDCALLYPGRPPH